MFEDFRIQIFEILHYKKKSVERAKTRVLSSEFMIQEKQNWIQQTLMTTNYLKKNLQFHCI